MAVRAMVDILQLEQIQLPPYYVFVGHGWLQHAEARCLGHDIVRYHLQLIPQNMFLKKEICFLHVLNLQFRNEREDWLWQSLPRLYRRYTGGADCRRVVILLVDCLH